MERSNAVYTVAGCKTQVCHAHLTVVMDNRHILNLTEVAGEAVIQFRSLASVNLMDNLTETRKKRINHFHRPFLKRFAEDSVVCICEGFADYIPRIVPRHAFFVHENTHKLRNSDCRMRIIDMNLYIVRNVKQRQVFLLML